MLTVPNGSVFDVDLAEAASQNVKGLGFRV